MPTHQDIEGAIVNRLAWYYDWTPDRHISDDPDGESNLCWLCPDCATDLGEKVSLAGSEDVVIGRACDVCGCAEAFDAITTDRPSSEDFVMIEMDLKLKRDDALGFIVSHAEQGPNGRIYQFRAGDAPGMLLYRWAYTNTPSTFGPWRLIGDGIFPGVREMLALAHAGKIAP